MCEYKNISVRDLWLPGIGDVKAGGVINQPDGFNNANFEKVEEVETSKTTQPNKGEGSGKGFIKRRVKTKER